jgi:hypothetical protein
LRYRGVPQVSETVRKEEVDVDADDADRRR